MKINTLKVGDSVLITGRGRTNSHYSITSDMEEMIGNGKVYTVGLVNGACIVLEEEDTWSWHYTSLELYDNVSQDKDNLI